MLNVTKHASKRIKDRCGKSMDRLAQIAFDKGLTHTETSGSLNSYLYSLYEYNQTANNIRLYGDKIFIFCDEVLVTVLNTPRKYRETVNKLMSRRIHAKQRTDTRNAYVWHTR